MTWENTWSDILSGGNPRWKITSPQSHQKALSYFQQYVTTPPSSTSVFCPLAGDDPFVHLLWKTGYSVTSIDLVPSAVDALREQFGDVSEWSKKVRDDGTVIWNHSGGRATLMVGDALQRRPELEGTFDAVYDKDSFGAIGKEMRKGYCARIAEFTKMGAVVYLECKLKKNHDEVKDHGPPYSLKREDLIEEDSYGENFEYVVGLNSVYDLEFDMQQTGHILKRIDKSSEDRR